MMFTWSASWVPCKSCKCYNSWRV